MSTVVVSIPIGHNRGMPLLETLNASQRAAVTHAEGPLLIVAGAGTGKTTVLTQRYSYLLEERKLKPEHILALTFTEKAAGEMEDRIIKLLPTGAYDFWIYTFHGFCQRVLEAHGLEIGLPNQFRLLTETDAWILLKRHIQDLPLKHYRPLGNPVKFLRGLLSHISRAKDEGITPERYQQFVQEMVLDGDEEFVTGEKARLQELADLYFAYRKLMLEQGYLDFGDLILEVLRLFRERPAVLEKYRAQFQFLMVDEFQDTNWAQYELVKLLCGKKRNITVVGDDDQAIYKFRGASLANILQFRDDFQDAVTVTLTDNYRSHREILDLAYSFIKHNNPNRLEVRLADTGLSKALEAARGGGGEIQVIWRKTIEDEADAVVDDIKRKKHLNNETVWNDFAILVRSNDSAEPFVRALERAGIPFQFLALRGLYAKPVILDLISLLSLLDGYHESPAVWRVLTLPCYNVPAMDIAALLQRAERQGYPLWWAVKEAARGITLPEKDGEVGQISEQGRIVLGRIVSHVEGLAESARREEPLRVLQKAIEKSGYLDAIMRFEERQKMETLQFLNAFVARVRRYEQASHGPSMRGFLEEFQAELESGEEGALSQNPDEGPDMVKIMTVHAAKGLEFKHVFVVSLVDQRFPTRPRTESIPLPDGLVQERLPEGDLHLEEERRLFYVALTRARDTLTLCGAQDYGGTRQKKPSVFIHECGLEVAESTLSSPLTKRLTVEEPIASPTEQPLHLYKLKKRFSFTQLAAFRKCPLQYKFEHIYKIPKLGTYQKVFGQSIHAAFQHVLDLHLARGKAKQTSLFGSQDELFPVTEGGFRVTEEEALALFEEDWRDEWYETRKDHDEHFAKGRQAVKHFWKACAAKAPDVLEVEKPFTLILGDHSLIGKVDRVDRMPNDEVWIFDYKTGTARETLDAEDKEQLYLYQIALEERGMRVAGMSYIYVSDWTIKEVEPLEGDKREAFLEKLAERMQAIIDSDYQPKPEPFTCKYCDFKSICEFKKL